MKSTFLKTILTVCFFSAITVLNTSCNNLSTSSKTIRDSTDSNPPRMVDTLMLHDSTTGNPPAVQMKATINAKLGDSTTGNPPVKVKVTTSRLHDSTTGNPPK